MPKEFEKLLANLNQIEPSENLYGIVLSRIEAIKKRTARVRLILLSGATLAALIALVTAFQYLINDFYQSGSYQYLSLLFSDGEAVMAYWQDFTLSLVESLPFMSMTAVLSVTFVLLGSLKFMARDVKTLFLSAA